MIVFVNTGITLGLTAMMNFVVDMVVIPFRSQRSKPIMAFATLCKLAIWGWWLSGFVIPYPSYAGVRGWYALESFMKK